MSNPVPGILICSEQPLSGQNLLRKHSMPVGSEVVWHPGDAIILALDLAPTTRVEITDQARSISALHQAYEHLVEKVRQLNGPVAAPSSDSPVFGSW